MCDPRCVARPMNSDVRLPDHDRSVCGCTCHQPLQVPVKTNHNNNVRAQSKLEEENFFLRTQLESLLHELHVKNDLVSSSSSSSRSSGSSSARGASFLASLSSSPARPRLMSARFVSPVFAVVAFPYGGRRRRRGVCLFGPGSMSTNGGHVSRTGRLLWGRRELFRATWGDCWLHIIM